MPNTDDSTNAARTTKESGNPRVGTIWGIGYMKRKLHERATKRERETTQDKAARTTANATVWIAVFTVLLALVSIKTLMEVHEGGKDTHDLAVAAGKQADRLKDLADRMKDQADRTKIIANQATLQAKAANGMSETAIKAFTVSNRPWVKIKHWIISPLTFNVGGRVGSPVATITIEDTLENVGPTVALNVTSWEEVVPTEWYSSGIPSIAAAQKRRREWCDANRHPAKAL